MMILQVVLLSRGCGTAISCLQAEDQKTKDHVTEILAMRSDSRGSSTSQKEQWNVSQEDGIEILR